jgi:hypothetical protein
LTDTLDDLIQDHRIDPQLAMKILANFDRAIAEVLQEKVRSRLTFKVNTLYRPCPNHPFARSSDDAPASPWLTFLATTGKPGYLQILRRGLDLPAEERDLQDGQRPAQRHYRQGQDRIVHGQAPGHHLGHDGYYGASGERLWNAIVGNVRSHTGEMNCI